MSEGGLHQKPMLAGVRVCPGRLMRVSGLGRGAADSLAGGRRRVSTVDDWALESFPKIVPLPVSGRVDRCWDVVPAWNGVSTVSLVCRRFSRWLLALCVVVTGEC